MAAGGTGYVYDERFLEHDTGEAAIPLPAGGELEPVEHPSSVRITRRTAALLEGSGLMDGLQRLPVERASDEQVELYHTPAHIERIRQLCEAGGGEAGTVPGESTPLAPASCDAAFLAVGGGIVAVDAVMAGRVKNAYSLLRPPGHHAMAEAAMGFCIFNNIVIAARHAQRTHGIRRVMMVDWDVHHGNGTQAAFYADPDVLFLSLHQDDWYPAGWGKVGDIGTDGAEGKTVNIPLPGGTGDRGYVEAFERVVLPIAQQFEPELLLVSAGQDPNMMDPLGRMVVTMDGFRAMATLLREAAEQICGGRLAILQEGGYSPAYVPFCTLAAVEGLADMQSAVKDPNEGSSELSRAKREYSPWQSAAIDAVVEAQKPYWKLR